MAKVLIFAFALTIYVLSATRVANNQQEKPEYNIIGYNYDMENTLSVRAVPGEDPECIRRRAESTQISVKCPGVCKPFDPLTLPGEYAECAPTAQFGCVLEPCDAFNPNLGFSCSLNKTYFRDDLTVCQGQDVFFENANIDKFGEITFNIDISAPPVQTDLYVLADTTGSMNEAIGTAVLKARDLVKVFGDRENVAFGVGRYEDERDLDSGFGHMLKISKDDRQVIRTIRKWRTVDGQDVEEANLVALYRIATEDRIGWRQGARRFVVYFGDAPGHEPTCYNGMPITRQTVIDAMNKKNITVVAVNFGDLDMAPRSWPINGCGGSKGAPAGQATAITSATGGAIVSSNDQSKLIELIEKALSLVIRTYNVDDTDCRDKLDSVHTPPFPLVLQPLQKASVKHTIRIKPDVCTTDPKGFFCEYTYTERGANIFGGTQFQFLEIDGCKTREL